MTTLEALQRINKTFTVYDLKVFYEFIVPRRFEGCGYLSQEALELLLELDIISFPISGLRVGPLGERMLEYINWMSHVRLA